MPDGRDTLPSAARDLRFRLLRNAVQRDDAHEALLMIDDGKVSQSELINHLCNVVNVLMLERFGTTHGNFRMTSPRDWGAAAGFGGLQSEPGASPARARPASRCRSRDGARESPWIA